MSAPTSTATPRPNTFAADYPSLFGDLSIDQCLPDALQSKLGPLAYLKMLFDVASSLEKRFDDAPKSPLERRRPDIPALLLDEPALKRRVPRLTLVNDILEALIVGTAKADRTDRAACADILAAASWPPTLPFDGAWDRIMQVHWYKDLLRWDTLRQADRDYPGFACGAPAAVGMREVLPLCTHLSPAQIRNLVVPESTSLDAAPGDTAPSSASLRTRLGLPADVSVDSLTASASFLKVTGLNRKRLRQLLAVNGVAGAGDTAQVSSVRVSDAGKPGASPDSSAFGASYLNDGATAPLRLVRAGSDSGSAVTIEGLTAAHLDRVWRILRIQAGMDLSFAHIDRLLQAAFGAQRVEKGRRIDLNVLRVLGLYAHLRDSRSVDLDAYAAVVHEISPYATGRDTSYFDRLFAPGRAHAPPVMDGAPFAIEAPSAESSAAAPLVADATVRALCLGLGLREETLLRYLGWIRDARGERAPTRTLDFISACHRLALLPRWLGIADENEASALLELFRSTQGTLFAQLAQPRLNTEKGTDAPDIVDAIVTLMNMRDWLREHELPPARLFAVLAPGAARTATIDAADQIVTYHRAGGTTGLIHKTDLAPIFDRLAFAVDADDEDTDPFVLLASLIRPDGRLQKAAFLMTDMESMRAAVHDLLAEAPFQLTREDVATGTYAATLDSLFPEHLLEEADADSRFDEAVRKTSDILWAARRTQMDRASDVLAAIVPGIKDAKLRECVGRWISVSQEDLLALYLEHAGRTQIGRLAGAFRQPGELVALLGLTTDDVDAVAALPRKFGLDERTEDGSPGIIDLRTVYRLTEWNLVISEAARRAGNAPSETASRLIAWLRGDPVALEATLGVPKELLKLGNAAPADVHDLAWLLRVLALADRSGIAPGAIVALSASHAGSNAAWLSAVANQLMTNFGEADRTTMIGRHDASRRDAMLAWLHVHARDADNQPFADRDALADWLLTDISVGVEPQTTRVDAAVSSLQLYIHRLLSGLERRLDTAKDMNAVREAWTTYQARYEDWRSREERALYPENYIEPGRRQHKTRAFSDLETQLAQGQARPADIETNLLSYLTTFERVSNIQAISGYHEGIDPASNKLHIIGQSNAEPPEYFWRTADMSVKAPGDQFSMLAWSDWRAIDLPIVGELVSTVLPARPDAATLATLKKDRDTKRDVKAKSEITRDEAITKALASRAAADKAGATEEDIRTAHTDDDAAIAAAKEANKDVADLRDAESAYAVAQARAKDPRVELPAIRPLTIDGRRYVVWVERDTSPIVFDAEDRASNYYATRVCFSYQTSDGTWSSANRLIELNGYTADGNRKRPESDKNDYGMCAERRNLVTREYRPSLIVMENRKGRRRRREPLLVALLLNSRQTGSRGYPVRIDDGGQVSNAKRADAELSRLALADPSRLFLPQQYFIAVRDLLFVDKRELDEDKSGSLEYNLVKNWIELYGDPRVVQHPYLGTRYRLTSGDTSTSSDEDLREAVAKKIAMMDRRPPTLTAVISEDGERLTVTGAIDSVWRNRERPVIDSKEIHGPEDVLEIIIDESIVLTVESVRGVLGKAHFLDADGYEYDRTVFSKKGEIWTQSVTVRFTARARPDTVIPVDYRIFLNKADTEKPYGDFTVTSLPEGDLLRPYSGAFDVDPISMCVSYLVSKQAHQDGGDVSTITSGDLLQAKLGVNYEKKQVNLDTSRWVGTIVYAGVSWGAIRYTIKAVKQLSSQFVGSAFVPKPATESAGVNRFVALPVVAKLRVDAAAITVSDDPDLLSELKSVKLGELYTLSQADTQAARTWLPKLDPFAWRVDNRSYNEALTPSQEEQKSSANVALKGSVAFLQAVQSLDGEQKGALRSTFSALLFRTVSNAGGAALGLPLVENIVRFAITHAEAYGALHSRLTASLGNQGGRANEPLEKKLHMEKAGRKKIEVSLPVDPETRSYPVTFTLEATDDPANNPEGPTKAWLTLERTFTLVDRAEEGSSPDDRVPTVYIWHNTANAQYLDLDESGRPPVRLNTLFGKPLVGRAARSVDAVLSFEAQTLPEPALRDGGSGGFVDFRGANGLYFWELFFHVPWLVAWNLREKREYEAAWRWCSQYLFDPYRGQTTSATPPRPFWNSMPLIYPMSVASDTGEAVELAGYAAHVHFQKALHAFAVDLWLRQGDELFRKLTPESLQEAWLCYQRALRLIGTLEEPGDATPWKPVTLRSLGEAFVAPVNLRLREIRDLILSRLSNLRHGRAIDGTLLPYIGRGVDESLTFSGGRGGTGAMQDLLRMNQIPHHRFRDGLAFAQAAVERLTDLGRYLFHIAEHEADNAYEVEKQTTLMAVSDFDVSLRRQAILTVEREGMTLKASRRNVEKRVRHYTEQVGRNPLEILASTTGYAAVATLYATSAPVLAKVPLRSLMNVFGMSSGGNKWDAAPDAIEEKLETFAEATRLLAEDLRTEAAYNRRDDEFRHEIELARGDLEILSAQEAEQASRLATAKKELDQAVAQQGRLRTEFATLTSGFAIADTYTWMLGRLGELYASAYQSVLSLCLSAEASYMFETGDFGTRHVRLDAWQGAWRGMFAGEALQNDLQAMQSSYLRVHERRPLIHKDISIATLAGGGPKTTPGKDAEGRDISVRTFDNRQLAEGLKKNRLWIRLTQKMFDEDYPGHYLRQIRHVSVEFKLKPDAKTLTETSVLRAVLTQRANNLHVTPDIEGARWLRAPGSETPSSIRRNLRANQYILISSTKPRVHDDPMTTVVLRNEFMDGRYTPFEGTGAVSEWTLTLPGDEAMRAAYAEDIEDIVLRLDYSAVWGGGAFTFQVKELMQENTKAPPTTRVVSSHAPAEPGSDARSEAGIRRFIANLAIAWRALKASSGVSRDEKLTLLQTFYALQDGKGTDVTKEKDQQRLWNTALQSADCVVTDPGESPSVSYEHPYDLGGIKEKLRLNWTGSGYEVIEHTLVDPSRRPPVESGSPDTPDAPPKPAEPDTPPKPVEPDTPPKPAEPDTPTKPAEPDTPPEPVTPDTPQLPEDKQPASAALSWPERDDAEIYRVTGDIPVRETAEEIDAKKIIDEFYGIWRDASDETAMARSIESFTPDNMTHVRYYFRQTTVVKIVSYSARTVVRNETMHSLFLQVFVALKEAHPRASPSRDIFEFREGKLVSASRRGGWVD